MHLQVIHHLKLYHVVSRHDWTWLYPTNKPTTRPSLELAELGILSTSHMPRKRKNRLAKHRRIISSIHISRLYPLYGKNTIPMVPTFDILGSFPPKGSGHLWHHGASCSDDVGPNYGADQHTLAAVGHVGPWSSWFKLPQSLGLVNKAGWVVKMPGKSQAPKKNRL